MNSRTSKTEMSYKKGSKVDQYKEDSDASHTFLSDSDDRETKKMKRKQLQKEDFVKFNENNIEQVFINYRTNIEALQNRIYSHEKQLDEKEDVIAKLRNVMENDDLVKDQLNEKIRELKASIENFQSGLSHFDDNDLDEELNDLLKDKDKSHYDLFSDNKNENIFLYNVNKNIGIDNQMMILGNAMMNDYNTRISQVNQETCWGSMWESIYSFLNIFLPFKANIRFLYSRYDRNTTGVFEFIRTLYMFGILIFITSLYLNINHLFLYFRTLNTSSTNATSSSVSSTADPILCKLFIPCVMYYSRYSADERQAYSFTYLAICIVLFGCLVIKWSDYKRHELLQGLFDSEEICYSKIVFNMWDWNTKNENSQIDTTCMLKNIFTIGLAENEIKEMIKYRTSKEKCMLILRRCVSFFLSLIILALDAAAIVGLYALQAYLQFIDSNPTSTKALIYGIIPGIGITIISIICQILFELCIKLEKWDFNSTKVSQLMWRIYLAKLFTVAIVYLLIIEFTLLETDEAQVLPFTSLDFKLALTCPTNSTYVNPVPSGAQMIDYTGYANCKEDEASNRLFLNLLVDFVCRKLIPIGTVIFRWLILSKCCSKKSYKQHFDVIDIATDQLIFSLNMYMLIPIFPIITLLFPFLLFVEFKFELFNLTHIRTKPQGRSLQDKTGYFIMTLYTFTGIAMIILFILYFVNKITRHGYMQCFTTSSGEYVYSTIDTNCGPFSNEESPKSIVYQSLANNTVVFTVYEGMANPLYILIAAFLLLIIIAYSCKVSNALNFYINIKSREAKSTESSLNEVIRKLRDQIRFLKLRAAPHVK